MQYLPQTNCSGDKSRMLLLNVNCGWLQIAEIFFFSKFLRITYCGNQANAQSQSKEVEFICNRFKFGELEKAFSSIEISLLFPRSSSTRDSSPMKAFLLIDVTRLWTKDSFMSRFRLLKKLIESSMVHEMKLLFSSLKQFKMILGMY